MRIVKSTEQNGGNFLNLNSSVSRTAAKLQKIETCFEYSILYTEFELSCKLQETFFRLKKKEPKI
jgi:hypothetical protein